MDLKNYSDGKYTYSDIVMQLDYLNCLFLHVLRSLGQKSLGISREWVGRFFISLHKNHSFIEQQRLNRHVISPELELYM